MRNNPLMPKEQEDEYERKVHTDLPGKRKVSARREHNSLLIRYKKKFSELLLSLKR